MSDLLIERDALISPCGMYRYWLQRTWDPSRFALPFVMLNPSTADAEVDDPTIRRCMGFAKREHYGGIWVANLYAFRATRPEALWKAADPYGPENDDTLVRLARRAAVHSIPIVCAWGANGGKNNRPIVLMQQAGASFACLGRTKDGQPRHPLYVKADQKLEPYP